MPEDPLGSGNFSARASGTLDPLQLNSWSGDVDYFSFEALAGDILSISVDTPNSDLNPSVSLCNSGDGELASNNDSGPDADAFISHYTITSSGKYYARVSKGNYSSDTPGAYELRVDVARNINLESDAQYANDTIAGADRLAMSVGAPQHLVADVAGAIMADEGAQTDDDLFSLGTFNTGNVVELTTQLPSQSVLDPNVWLIDADGNALADEDGSPGDGHFAELRPATRRGNRRGRR